MLRAQDIEFPHASSQAEASREAGYNRGTSLGSYRDGVASIEAALRAQVDQVRQRANAELKRVESEIERYQQIDQSGEVPLALALENLQTQEKGRAAQPSDYALIKGLLYLTLSLLLVLADVSILGQVLARLLDYQWRLPGKNQSFATLFFVDPIEAYQQFPDLFCLTFSVLVIGLFIKVWLDSFSSLAERTSNGSSKFEKTKFALYTVFFILSVASVAFLAWARWFIPIGGESSKISQLVAMTLGLSLPLVSAGFFIRGYEVVGQRLDLWKADWLVRRCQRKREKIWEEIRRLKIQRAQLEDIVGPASDAFLVGELEKRQSSFSAGYLDGIKVLIQRDGTFSLYERLKPIAVAKVMR